MLILSTILSNVSIPGLTKWKNAEDCQEIKKIYFKTRRKINIYLYNMLADRLFVWLLLFAQCHMCHDHMVHKSPATYQLLAPAKKPEIKPQKLTKDIQKKHISWTKTEHAPET